MLSFPESSPPGRKKLTGDVAIQVREGINQLKSDIARNGNFIYPVLNQARNGTRSVKIYTQRPSDEYFRPGRDDSTSI